MARAHTTETTLYGFERAGHSRNGNPAWRLFTADGVFRTGTDAAVGYEVDNLSRPLREHANALPVLLTLTRAGRVVDIAPLVPGA